MPAKLSGSDPGLKNVWDEICVQVQFQESAFWDSYVAVMEQVIAHHLKDLKLELRQAIWLQTDEGIHWEPDPDDSAVPEVDDDMAAYIRAEYVMPQAADWSNARIERYLERSSEHD
jgi:hypothetical protein